jgi:hypothetical protein
MLGLHLAGEVRGGGEDYLTAVQKVLPSSAVPPHWYGLGQLSCPFVTAHAITQRR